MQHCRFEEPLHPSPAHLNSCMGVCPKWRICSSTALRCRVALESTDGWRRIRGSVGECARDAGGAGEGMHAGHSPCKRCRRPPPRHLTVSGSAMASSSTLPSYVSCGGRGMWGAEGRGVCVLEQGARAGCARSQGGSAWSASRPAEPNSLPPSAGTHVIKHVERLLGGAACAAAGGGGSRVGVLRAAGLAQPSPTQHSAHQA